jgi:hypothetical protein
MNDAEQSKNRKGVKFEDVIDSAEEGSTTENIEVIEE